MPLWTLLSASLGVYLLVRLRLEPLATARLNEDNTLAAVAKAATLGGLKSIRSLAAIATGIAAAIYAIAFGLQILGFAIPPLAPAFLHVADAVHASTSVFNERLSAGLFLFSAAALVWLTRTAAAQDRRRQLEEAVNRELERLRRESGERGWADLPPTPAMIDIQKKALQLQTVLESGVHDGRPIDQRTAAALQNVLRQLGENWRLLDLDRRINPRVEARADRRGSLRFLFSAGTYGALRAVRKRVGQLTAVTAIAGLVGVASPAMVTAAANAQIQLTDLIVTRSAADAESAWQDRKGPQQPTREDQRALNNAASAFERAFARSLAPHGFEHADRAAEVRRLWARRRVIDAIAEKPHSPDLAEYRSMVDLPGLDGTAQAAVRDLAPVPWVEEPQTTIGVRFRERLRQRVLGSPAWEHFKANYANAFEDTAPVNEVGGELLEQAFGAVIGFGPTPTDPMAKQMTKALDGIPRAALTKYYELKCAQFEGEIARGTDPAAILDIIGGRSGAFRFLDDAALMQVNAARASLHAALPTDALRESPPRFRQVGVDARADVPSSYDAIASEADAIAVYEDYFPGWRGAVTATPRARFLERAAANTAVDSDLAKRIEALVAETTVREKQLMQIAVDPKALSGFSKVGGVVIGEAPTRVSATAITGITATPTPRGLNVSVVVNRKARDIGTYSPAVVRAALGYSADDRRLAVTMLLVRNSERKDGAHRVILHPALIDTPVGAALIDADHFIFDATEASRVRKNLEESITLQDALYHVAVFARVSGTLKARAERNATVVDLQNNLEQEIAAFERQLDLPENRPLVGAVLGDGHAWTDGARSILVSRPDYYDSEMVGEMRKAASHSHGVKDFVAALEADSLPTLDSIPKLLGRVVSFGVQINSGVREQSYQIDSTDGFLKETGTMWPFSFKILATFDVAPIAADATAADDNAVRNAWTFPESGDLQTTADVQRWVAADANRAESFRVVQAFTKLQRLFRAAFDGNLGEDFDLESVVRLAQSLPAEAAAQTPRWSR